MKICIVGFTSKALEGTYLGGAEKQQALLAAGLAAMGHEVVCVEPGYGGPDGNVGLVQQRSGWLPDRGLRAVRFFTYRLPSLRSVLNDVAADVYYARGFSIFAPTVVAVANRRNAVSVVGLAHDTDLQLGRAAGFAPEGNSYEALQCGRAAFLYFRRFALAKAGCVVAQTADQARVCERLGFACSIIPNAVETPVLADASDPAGSDVIWVNSFQKWKGVDQLLELIDMMPETRFQVIGSNDQGAMQWATDRLARLPNVRYSSRVPHSGVFDALASSKIAINTAPAEGLSNVFLEAWAVGRPVVSLHVNPDGLLDGSLGGCALGSLKAMSEIIRTYLSDDVLREETGVRALEHVRANHSTEHMCEAFELAVVEASRRRAEGSVRPYAGI